MNTKEIDMDRAKFYKEQGMVVRQLPIRHRLNTYEWPSWPGRGTEKETVCEEYRLVGPAPSEVEVRVTSLFHSVRKDWHRPAGKIGNVEIRGEELFHAVRLMHRRQMRRTKGD